MKVDVVVIGAGSAGGVVAALRSEEPERRVVLVEAGPDFGAEIAAQPPEILDAADPTGTGYDWGHTGESGIPLLAGRMVGGSSATNNVMALRGGLAVYESWGWSFEDVLPAFVRLERDLDFPGKPWHGDRGPIPVRRPSGADQAPFLRACEELGRSRGVLWATAAGPPSIDPGHLREPEDAEHLTAGARLAHRLATHLGVDGPEPVLANVGSYQHPVGTCRMGPAGDPHAVVDGTGRVHGLAGLSVIDASILPSIPSANTNLPTLMLAERLA